MRRAFKVLRKNIIENFNYEFSKLYLQVNIYFIFLYYREKKVFFFITLVKVSKAYFFEYFNG